MRIFFLKQMKPMKQTFSFYKDSRKNNKINKIKQFLKRFSIFIFDHSSCFDSYSPIMRIFIFEEFQ